MSKYPSAAKKARKAARKEEKRRTLMKEVLGASAMKVPPNLTEKQRNQWFKERKMAFKDQIRGPREASTFKFTDMHKRVLGKLLDVIRKLPEANSMPEYDRNRKDTSLQKEFRWFDRDRNEQTRESRSERVYPMTKKASNEALLEKRKALPAYQLFNEKIWPIIKNNQISVLAGATGCGKTTQIPQLILDAEIDQGNYGTKIVCTQPRRIAAISVAQRVADERGEKCSSMRTASVGYHVKMENLPPRDYSSVLYCTPGIVLQWLRNDASLQEVSYLILDEVHERNLETDFLMAICKVLLPKRPDLKLILMSATMNTKSFSEYFNKAPIIDVPGRMFPIKEYHLEDLFDMDINLNSWQNDWNLRKLVPNFFNNLHLQDDTCKASGTWSDMPKNGLGESYNSQIVNEIGAMNEEQRKEYNKIKVEFFGGFWRVCRNLGWARNIFFFNKFYSFIFFCTFGPTHPNKKNHHPHPKKTSPPLHTTSTKPTPETTEKSNPS